MATPNASKVAKMVAQAGGGMEGLNRVLPRAKENVTRPIGPKKLARWIKKAGIKA